MIANIFKILIRLLDLVGYSRRSCNFLCVYIVVFILITVLLFHSLQQGCNLLFKPLLYTVGILKTDFDLVSAL